MIEHIEELFTESKTVIIPGLGALTITNTDTNELMFMPYLKHDDGALSGFMANKLGISSDDAKAQIASEVLSILSDLEAGKTSSLGKFGYFTKNGDDVVFENSGAGNEIPKPEEKVIKEPAKEEKPVAKAEEKPKAEKKSATKKETPKKTEPKEEEKPKKVRKVVAKPKATKTEAEKPKTVAKAETKKEEKPTTEKKSTAKKDASVVDAKKAAPVKEEKAPEQPKAKDDNRAKKEEEKQPVAKTSTAKVASTTIPVDKKEEAPKKEMNILEKEEVAANEEKLAKLKKQQEEGKKKKKKGVGFYILVFVIALIVGGGSFVAFNYDKMGDYLPFLAENKVEDKGDSEVAKMKEMAGNEEESSEDEEEIIEEQDTTLMDETVAEPEMEEVAVEEPVEEKTVQQPVINSGSNNQPFHIVAGVFSDPGNADRLAENIRGMGYPAKTFMRGDKTVVSVKSFSSKEEAQAAIPSVADAAPKGWVLEWR